MASVTAGCSEAYAELVDRFLPILHRFGYRILANPDEVEDLVQETLVRVWTHAHQWRPGRSKVTTWIHTIMHNLCIDHLRKSRRHNVEDIAHRLEGNDTPDGTLATDDRAREIRLALAALPERQRNAIVLCYFQGFSNRDAAQVIGVSVDGLESLMARGRRTMRERLKHLSASTGQD